MFAGVTMELENSLLNYARLTVLLVQTGTQVLRELFLKCLPPHTIDSFFQQANVENKIKYHCKRKILNPNQKEKLFSPEVNANDFDISLLVVLLTNFFCPSLVEKPATGWTKELEVNDFSLGADLVRLRNVRNKILAHRSHGRLNDADFEELWSNVKDVLLRIASSAMLNKASSFNEEINKIKCMFRTANIEASSRFAPDSLLVYDSEKRTSLINPFSFWTKIGGWLLEKSGLKQHDEASSQENKVKSLLEEKLKILEKWRQEETEFTAEVKEHMEKTNERLVKLEATVRNVTVYGCAGAEGGETLDIEEDHCDGENDERLSNKELRNAASEDRFTELAYELEFTRQQIKNFPYPCTYQIRLQLLIKWRDALIKHGENPRLALAVALKNMDNIRLAREITKGQPVDGEYEVRPSAKRAVQSITI